MKDKRKLLLALIGSLLLLSTFVVVSYAYFLSNIDINNTSNVNTAIENMPNFSFNANSTPSIELNVSFSNMFDSVLGIAAQNSVTENISLSSTDSIPIFCTYDIVWVWDETSDSQNQYIKTPGASNEYVVGGTNGEESFEEAQVSNYGNTKVLYSGFITSSTPTPTVEVWTYNVKFYNIDANQNAHMGSLYSSRIEVQNVNCDLGLGENGDIIADANRAFDDPNTFTKKILEDNGGATAILAKGDPDFSSTAPKLTFVEGELGASVQATPNTNNYFTYSNSYYFDTLTGHYALKNDDGNSDLINVTLANNVIKYSEGYANLVGKYVGNVKGSSTNSLYQYSQLVTIYKITAATETTITYQSLTPLVASEDNSNDGIYATDDDYTEVTGRKSYYFRGAIDNNWVSFAGYYWRIIRINGDGSIRMIYSGTIAPSQETKTVMTGNQTIIPGLVAFNRVTPLTAEYVGWKYTLGEGHGISTSSTIKGDDASPAVGSVDEWYYSNIANNYAYLSKISQNQILCNDRTAYADISGTTPTSGIGSETQYFGSYVRNIQKNQPRLVCSNASDKFTINGVTTGNQSLTYSVGLITADEAVMAGMKSEPINPKNYLYTERSYWVASPSSSYLGSSYVFAIYQYGKLYWYSSSTLGVGIRPVISLKSDIEVSGNGTWNDPYVVE